MKIFLFIFGIFLLTVQSHLNSEIFDKIIIEEGKMSTEPLANLTKLLIKNHQISDVLIKNITIYPISESDLYPFKIKSREILQLSSSIDRESICSEGITKSLPQVCPKDTCCKLLGFQYTLSADIQSFFILIIIIDVNDQEPKFQLIERPFIKISENVEERFLINLPIAEDRDSHLYSVQRYTIFQQVPQAPMNDFQFFIGNEIPLKPKLFVKTSLDYERTKKYKLKLTAFDSILENVGHSCSIIVEIEIQDINDNTPKFEQVQYNVYIRENELMDTILKWKVLDADSEKNGMVSVTIDKEEMKRKFKIINIKMNEGYLGLITPLDYENDPKSFQFSLVAKDHGIPSRSSSASINVTLTNVNDNAPRIEFKMLGHSISNMVSIKEGLMANSLVTEVRVTDADNLKEEIYCVLIDSANLFYLDQTIQHTQFLAYKPYNLKTISIIDRESDRGHSLRITVQCKDGKLSSNESLKIQIEDINDNSPIFSKQTFVGIVEENQVNANVQFIAPVMVTDKDFGDNAKLNFFLKDFKNSTDSKKFYCDKNTVKIVTQKSLDFEQQKQFRFMLIARDESFHSLSGTCTLLVNVIDLNDNAPVFNESHYSFKISEDVKVGTKIGMVSATDKDSTPINKVIIYTIEKRNIDSIEVDKHSGEIRTRKALDRESLESITFRIIASNPNPLANSHIRDLESEVHVMIKVLDVNDNPPTFKQKPNVKARIEFIMEQYVEGSTCAELPYTVQDADDEGLTGSHCCTISLENDYNNLLSLMTNTPSYICLMRPPLKYQSLTITLVAKDRPLDYQKSLISKISFPLLIKTDPNIKINNHRLPEPSDTPESNIPYSRNIVILAIFTTVVLVFLIIIIIIIIIIRRCTMVDQEYDGRKCSQNINHPRDVLSNINSLMAEQSGKMTVQRGYIPSSQYSDNFQMSRTNLQSQSTLSSKFSPPTYHQIMTNQGIRIMANPTLAPDQYLYKWSPDAEEHQRLMTVPRSVINSVSEKVRPLSPTRSESLHCQSKSLLDTQHDSGYQILNPFNAFSSPQHHNNNYTPEEVLIYDNNENRSMTLMNNFFDEENNGETNKTTPMTMKRSYFQTTFV